jgi:FtsP/CotA-like multicopper oxidase with cupredoxin domain
MAAPAIAQHFSYKPRWCDVMLRSLAILVAVASPALAGAQLCEGRGDTLAASNDLYCSTLVPTAGLDAVAAHVELGRIAGPFTVAVTVDGRPRYTPVVTIAGLPPASSLGASTYVAWAAPPTMYPVRKLGTVRNGRTRLLPLTLDPFVVLITAERSAAVREPTGRLVLRGQSPSSRLQPADLLQFAVGATSERDAPVPPAPLDSTAARWTGVPMSPGIAMLPAEMALRPAMAPSLPRLSGGAPPAAGRPGDVVRLSDGDTLHLTADLVQRRIRGRVLTMYAFNRQYPGPRIVVRQGTGIVVDFVNRLDQPTGIHWHGIRLDNPFDGVPGLTQDAVAPGGRFVYRLRFPDAGTYWYHPHIREDMQQDLGLYGNIVVEPRNGAPVRFRQQILILDDLLVTGDGLVPYGTSGATHALMGRFGNVLLVNGQPGYHLAIRRGEVVQFHLTNASSTRVFNLSFPGARMKVIGSDGGRFEHEAWVESVVIAPAERYVVQVRFGAAGPVPLINRVRALDHLFGRFVAIADTLGVVDVGSVPVRPDPAARFGLLHTDAGVVADIDRYRAYAARPPDRTLLLTLRTHGLPFVTRQIMLLDSAYFAPVEWAESMPNMNWAATSDQVRWVIRDPATGRENMDIDWRFRRDTVIKLRLVNDRAALHGMQHPIHLHGQRFLVLAVNGVPNDNLVWKDTVLVPAGAAVDVLLDLSNPGRWMIHCHIAEHLTAQMMAALTVE